MSNAATEEVIFFLFEIIVYKFQLYTSSVYKIECVFKEEDI